MFSDICGVVPWLAAMDEGATFEHKQNAVMATWNCTTFCVAPNSASWGLAKWTCLDLHAKISVELGFNWVEMVVGFTWC